MILITLLITRTPSPPPIRSYQRDLIRYMVEAQAADSMSLQSNEVITMICMSIQSNEVILMSKTVAKHGAGLPI